MYILLGIVEATAIVLNGLFIFLLWWKSILSKSHKYCLYSLAVSNLTIAVICLNWDMNMYVRPTSAPPWVCFIQFYGNICGIYSTLGTIVVIGFDKCMAISRPHSYQKSICKTKHTFICLGLVWVLAIVLTLIPSADFLDNLTPVCNASNLYSRNYAVPVVATFLLMYFLADAGTFTCLIIILFKFLWTTKSQADQSANISRNVKSKARRATKIVVCSSFMYIVTMLPTVVYMFWLCQDDLDLAYALNHEYTIAVNCFIIFLTYIDPLAYFLSAIKFPFSRKIYPSNLQVSPQP